MTNAERIEAYYRKAHLLKQLNPYGFTQRYRRGLKVQAAIKAIKYLANRKRGQ